MAASKVENKFGIEILSAIYEKDIKTPEQRCVVNAHWALLMAGFRCVGQGDAKELTGDEKPSELLPEGWEKGPNHLLRYINDKKKLFILKINSMGDDAIISLIRAEDMKITSMALPMTPEEERRDWNKLADDFAKELVCPLKPVIKQERERIPLVAPMRPRPPFPDEDFGIPDFHGQRVPPLFPAVGGSDLDPLGRYGPGGPSGMIFRPDTRGRFPGIRHDPILPGRGPFGRHPGPDPDHFQPPGSNEDYFS